MKQSYFVESELSTGMIIRSSHLRSWMQKHPLVMFFLLAYGIAWILWIPALLSDYGVGLLHVNPFLTIPLLAMGILLGPGFAGWFMAGVVDGSTGRRRWWRRFIHWRVHPVWYLFALYLPFLVNVVADLVCIGVEAPSLMPDVLATIPMQAHVILTYLPLVLIQIPGSPLGEEPGWRGFALPRLQASLGPLRGTLLLGGLWGMWHLPLILYSDDFRNASPIVPYLLVFLVVITAFALLLTVFFNVTNGSLFIVILAHAAYNTASPSVSQMLFTQEVGGSGLFPPAFHFFAWYAASFVLLALVATIATRGRLGYSVTRQV
jgi:uncharacterized protein